MKRTNTCLAMLFVVKALSLSTGVEAQSPEKMYQTGKAAYDRNDCLAAVKYLFAYRSMAGNQIDGHLLEELNSAIRYCDDRIELAVRTKKELDKHGHVTEVVIEVSGKADGIKEIKKTKRFHKPTQQQKQKPKLPTRVPKSSVHADVVKSGVIPVKEAKLIAVLPRADISAKEIFERKIASLESTNKVLQNNYERLTEAYIALKEKYSSSAYRSRRLLHADDPTKQHDPN